MLLTHSKTVTAAAREGLLTAAANCFRNASMPLREQEVTAHLALHTAAANRTALATATTSSKHYMQTDKLIVPYLKASTECLKAGFVEAAARCLGIAGQHDRCGRLLIAYGAAQAGSDSASAVTDNAEVLCNRAVLAFLEAGDVRAADHSVSVHLL
jgi:hypothetical protein